MRREPLLIRSAYAPCTPNDQQQAYRDELKPHSSRAVTSPRRLSTWGAASSRRSTPSAHHTSHIVKCWTKRATNFHDSAPLMRLGRPSGHRSAPGGGNPKSNTSRALMDPHRFCTQGAPAAATALVCVSLVLLNPLECSRLVCRRLACGRLACSRLVVVGFPSFGVQSVV